MTRLGVIAIILAAVALGTLLFLRSSAMDRAVVNAPHRCWIEHNPTQPGGVEEICGRASLAHNPIRWTR